MTRSLLALVLSLGCAGGTETGPADELPPALEVSSPQRGAVSGEDKVWVEGHVSDDSGKRVRLTVAGELVNPSSDGTFRHRLELEPGFHLLETVATDAAGNVSRDLRALVIGDLVDGADGAERALRAHVGADQLDVVAEVIATQVESLDFGALLAANNPVFKTGGGCLRASVDVEGVDIADVQVSAEPQAGALRLEVALIDVHVDLLADYRVACVGGKQSIDVDADRIGIAGDLIMTIEDGEVVAVLEDAEVSSQGLDADIGFAPLEPLVNAIDQVIFNRLAGSLEGQLAEQVARLVDQSVNRSYTLSFDGIDFRYRIAPTAIALGTNGVGFDASLRAWVDDQPAVAYVGSQTSMPKLADDGVSMAVADDAATHILSVLWAAGVFDRSFDTESLGVFPELSRLQLELPMSPVVESTEQGLTVTVADARIFLHTDRNGPEELAVELVASAVVVATLGVDAEGGLDVDLDIETLVVQVVDERPVASDILAVDALEALAGAAIEIVLNDVQGQLSGLQLPEVFGVELSIQSAEAGDGGAIVSGSLELP